MAENSGYAISLEGERADALAFYHGEQWPPEVAKKRREQGRPCLVVNKLPELVDIAIKDIEARGGTVSPKERMELILQAVRNNRDTQTYYNYWMSHEAENHGKCFVIPLPAPVEWKWYLNTAAGQSFIREESSSLHCVMIPTNGAL